jgi:hypothetical protein
MEAQKNSTVKFYISAVSPLGFVIEGKNLNYYDDKVLQQRIQPFVIDCMEKQLLLVSTETFVSALAKVRTSNFFKKH